MVKYLEILKRLDAKLIKTELECFINDEGVDATIDEFFDYIMEDFSRGD